jgi:hypothetical protein
MTFLPALFLDFILTDLVIIATYVLFVFVWELIFPPKTKEQEKEEEEAIMTKSVRMKSRKSAGKKVI